MIAVARRDLSKLIFVLFLQLCFGFKAGLLLACKFFAELLGNDLLALNL